MFHDVTVKPTLCTIFTVVINNPCVTVNTSSNKGIPSKNGMPLMSLALGVNGFIQMKKIANVATAITQIAKIIRPLILYLFYLTIKASLEENHCIYFQNPSKYHLPDIQGRSSLFLFVPWLNKCPLSIVTPIDS